MSLVLGLTRLPTRLDCSHREALPVENPLPSSLLWPLAAVSSRRVVRLRASDPCWLLAGDVHFLQRLAVYSVIDDRAAGFPQNKGKSEPNKVLKTE